MLQDSLITIPNYILYHHDRQTIRPGSTDVIQKGGGLAVYTREEAHVDISTLADMNRSNEDIEIQCLIIRPPSKKSLCS